MAARPALTTGPITAIQNSAFGLSESRSSVATPPKMKSTIERTGIPKRSAVSAWPNSCSSTEPKSKTAEIAPAM